MMSLTAACGALVLFFHASMAARVREAHLESEGSAGAEGRASLGYTPAVHGRMVAQAFRRVRRTDAKLAAVLTKYSKAGMQKKTSGTCMLGACDPSIGKTDCLTKACFCQEGYGTKDGHTCEPLFALPLDSEETDTGVNCNYMSCSSSLGPTVCSESEAENWRCVCKQGYTLEDGVCTLRNKKAQEIVLTMLEVGTREPDELACPGDTFEDGTMNNAVMKMVVQMEDQYNMTLCRTAAQVYHASPLPLVERQELREIPIMNGYSGKDNAKKNLFSVMTMRQWRSQMLKIMAAQFAYAIVLPDLGEGARRLGNAFHTLSDGFSASHVERKHADGDLPASEQSCRDLMPTMATSMDVVNFFLHVPADMKESDILFDCSRFYEEKAIKLWAAARHAVVTELSVANEWVERVVAEVLCPAFAIPDKGLDRPAGGASAYYSATTYHPELPVGTASESDAERIIAAWREGLVANREAEDPRKQRSYPSGLYVPPRSEDVCKTPSLAHINSRHFEAAINNRLPPQYWVHNYAPAPRESSAQRPASGAVLALLLLWTAAAAASP